MKNNRILLLLILITLPLQGENIIYTDSVSIFDADQTTDGWIFQNNGATNDAFLINEDTSKIIHISDKGHLPMKIETKEYRPETGLWIFAVESGTEFIEMDSSHISRIWMDQHNRLHMYEYQIKRE